MLKQRNYTRRVLAQSSFGKQVGQVFKEYGQNSFFSHFISNFLCRQNLSSFSYEILIRLTLALALALTLLFLFDFAGVGVVFILGRNNFTVRGLVTVTVFMLMLGGNYLNVLFCLLCLWLCTSVAVNHNSTVFSLFFILQHWDFDFWILLHATFISRIGLKSKSNPIRPAHLTDSDTM